MFLCLTYVYFATIKSDLVKNIKMMWILNIFIILSIRICDTYLTVSWWRIKESILQFFFLTSNFEDAKNFDVEVVCPGNGEVRIINCNGLESRQSPRLRKNSQANSIDAAAVTFDLSQQLGASPGFIDWWGPTDVTGSTSTIKFVGFKDIYDCITLNLLYLLYC